MKNSSPSELNIVYGIRGERRLTELELPWLFGYEESKPVRTGNAAYQQFQLDIFGEVANTRRRLDLVPDGRRKTAGE
ncbi:MAG: hypothetical protein NVS9B5_26290 [Terriglobales bacterium]